MKFTGAADMDITNGLLGGTKIIPGVSVTFWFEGLNWTIMGLLENYGTVTEIDRANLAF